MAKSIIEREKEAAFREGRQKSDKKNLFRSINFYSLSSASAVGGRADGALYSGWKL